MKIQRFQNEELPYGILERFGLTQEMLEDLPQKAIEDILDGRRSPVLPIHVTDALTVSRRKSARHSLSTIPSSPPSQHPKGKRYRLSTR